MLDDNFLIKLRHVGIPHFRHSDTEKRFNDNLKTKSADWIWRNKSVYYTINAHGYRTKEWKDIIWNDSILLLGCSHVFGIGIDDNDTLDKKLSSMFEREVINLGIPAGSANAILYNTLRMIDEKIKPYMVICVFPSINRDCYFSLDHEVLNLGSWAESTKLYDQHVIDYIRSYLLDAENVKIKNYINEFSTELAWSSQQVPFFDYTLNQDDRVRDTTVIPHFDLDKARDDMHYGPLTVERWADFIYKDVQVKLK